MTNDVDRIRELLSPADPASGVDLAEELEATRTRLEATLVRSDRRSRPVVARQRVLLAGVAAAACVLVAAAALLVAGRGSPASADIVPPLRLGPPEDSAVEVLDRLARTAAAGDQGDGEVAYRRVAHWGLNTSVSDGEGTSVLAPSIVEEWIEPDGTVRSSRTAGEPLAPDGTIELDLAALAEGEVRETTARLPDPALIPAEPDEAKAWLDALSPNVPAPLQTWEMATMMLTQRPMRSQTRATIYRVLASLEDVAYRGRTVDRAGRQAEAFTLRTRVHGGPEELVLLIDPTTGATLSEESVLLEEPGLLDLPSYPAVGSYTAVVDSGFVVAAGDRPS